MKNILLFIKLYKVFFREHLFMLIFLTFLVILFVFVSSLNPYLFGILIDMMAKQQFDSFQNVLILYVGLNLLILLIGIIKERTSSIFSYKVSSQIKEKIHKKIMYMKCASHEKYSTGELMQRLQNDSSSIVTFYIDVSTSILSIVFNFAVSIYFIIGISPINAILSLVNIPLIFILNKLFRKRIAAVVKNQNKNNDERMSILHESIDNYKHVKIFCFEKEKADIYRKNLNSGLEILIKNLNITNAMGTIKGIIDAIISYGLFYIFALLIFRGVLTIGQMVSYNMYVTRLYDAIAKMSSMNINFISVRISLERIEQIESELSELTCCGEIDIVSDVQNKAFISSICFNKLFFSYSDNEPILRKISFSIDKKGFYSIVGVNGSGKSTLLALLMKLYDIDDDSIYINSIDINMISIRFIRKEIVYVSKDVYIINGSIKENLLINNPDISPFELDECCKKVGLYEDIVALEEGFNTLLGINGIQLSSGQKQKLNFARALLKKGSLYILDEATSDLDGVAEQDFIRMIRELSNNYIVILIAHRISSVIHSDEIIVLNNGSISGIGNHISLMQENEIYQDMFYGSLNIT